MNPPTFAHLLRTWREEAGWTVYRLGKTAGVDASHITRLEAGKQQPSLAIARRLAAALGEVWPNWTFPLEIDPKEMTMDKVAADTWIASQPTVRQAMRQIRQDLEGRDYLPGFWEYECQKGTLIVHNHKCMLGVFEAELTVGGVTLRRYRV